jgi:hypothetical protein
VRRQRDAEGSSEDSMNVMQRRTLATAVFAAGAFALAGACTNSPKGPGQLSVSLVDAAPTTVDQIVVNVTKVTAHSSANGWVTVSATPFTVDLLTLQAPATPLKLGTIALGAGKVTQIRLYVTKDGNWVHRIGDAVDVHTPLFVPSGYESGIKIIGPWDVAACEKTDVTLDFDGAASLQVHATGTGDQWILRPVIRIKSTTVSPVSCEIPTTGTCDDTHPCPEGQVCTESACVPDGRGAGAGAGCTANADCLSSVCVPGASPPAGTCAQSPPNGPCRNDGDCTNGSCDTVAGSCAPCSTDASCPTGQTCSGGICTQPNSGL